MGDFLWFLACWVAVSIIVVGAWGFVMWLAKKGDRLARGRQLEDDDDRP